MNLTDSSDLPAANRRKFWDNQPGLIWSNRSAPDDAFIAAALRKGRFLQLLDIAAEFGLERLQEVWYRELAFGDLSPTQIRLAEESIAIFETAHDRITASCDRQAVEAP